jgi:hypothetical protein
VLNPCPSALGKVGSLCLSFGIKGKIALQNELKGSFFSSFSTRVYWNCINLAFDGGIYLLAKTVIFIMRFLITNLLNFDNKITVFFFKPERTKVNITFF